MSSQLLVIYNNALWLSEQVSSDFLGENSNVYWKGFIFTKRDTSTEISDDRIHAN